MTLGVEISYIQVLQFIQKDFYFKDQFSIEYVFHLLISKVNAHNLLSPDASQKKPVEDSHKPLGHETLEWHCGI